MQMTQTTTHDSARPTRIARLTTVDDDKFFDLGLQAAECRLAAERPDLGALPAPVVRCPPTMAQ